MLKVDCEQLHPILAVRDVRAAIEFYTAKLGFWCAFDEGEFAGVNFGEVQLFLQAGAAGGDGVYFVVSGADALYEFHRANGVEIAVEIGDRPYGLRDYTVRDPDGHALTFGHRLSGR